LTSSIRWIIIDTLRGDAMNEHYNQNFTQEQISIILKAIQDCIREDKYIISKNENRQENVDFIKEYNLGIKRQKEILLLLTPYDFCHSLQNTNLGFEHEILYVFCPQAILYSTEKAEEQNVDIYIKFNFLDRNSGKRVVVVSFHKRNRPIDCPFRQ
jgi:hypothetical protein